jgi:hypothetical protein
MFWQWKKRAYEQLDKCIKLEEELKLSEERFFYADKANKEMSEKLNAIVEISNINQDAKEILDYKMELEHNNKKPQCVLMSKEVHTSLLSSFAILSTTVPYNFNTHGIGRIFGLTIYLSQEHRLKVE